eukprot:TRINITY_DN19662_c0_g1_i2.p1 TRINITY_DN19662_c0_g1~~TRINITY_DN19662_c0_g1_i2.p1  ORF type:complete len:522 (-),score=111.28 TRINITY_DN19662_c0_g1_i2:58-1623(-)
MNNMMDMVEKKEHGQSSCTASLYTQVLSVLAVNLGSLSMGLATGFSSILLPAIRKENSLGMIIHTAIDQVNITSTLYKPFTVDTMEEMWTDWLFIVGVAFGGLLSAFLGRILGSRRMLIMLSLPDLVGWVLIASSQNLQMLLVGRILTGVANGGYISNIQIYVAEISQTENRGWLAGLTMPVIATGVLAMHVVGSWLAWPFAAVIAAVVPCMLAMCVATLWDTPYWLSCQDNMEKCSLAALQHFRSGDPNILSEMLQIQECGGRDTIFNSLRKVFTDKKYYTPFFILNALFLLMTFSGKFTIDFYTSVLFQHASGNKTEYYSSMVTAFITLIGSCIFIPLVKTFPRRLLVATSALVMALSLTVLGISMYSHTQLSAAAVWISQSTWIPLLSATAFWVAAPVGLSSIPYIYAAEFFPTEVRSLLSGLTICAANLSRLLLVTTFPTTVYSLGHPGLVWCYAGVCLVALCLTLACVPETGDSMVGEMVGTQFRKWRKEERATPWASPATSPGMERKGRGEMFTL